MTLLISLCLAAISAAADPVPIVKPKAADAHCVKDQLDKALAFEKTYRSTHEAFSSSLKEAGVPKEVIELCPSWSDPVAKTTYGGSGVIIRSENPETGEAYTINQEGGFIQETLPKHKPEAR